MVQVPPFLLRRLYVKGSLHNTPEGFQFQLKNTLGAGYAEAFQPRPIGSRGAPRGCPDRGRGEPCPYRPRRQT